MKMDAKDGTVLKEPLSVWIDSGEQLQVRNGSVFIHN